MIYLLYSFLYLIVGVVVSALFLKYDSDYDQFLIPGTVLFWPLMLLIGLVGGFCYMFVYLVKILAGKK